MINYINNECYATPMNTIGMGNPSLPNGDVVGTIDALSVTQKLKKKKRLKSLKKYIEENK